MSLPEEITVAPDLVADQPEIDNNIDLELDAPVLVPWEQLAEPGETRLQFIRRILNEREVAAQERTKRSKRWSQINARSEQRLRKEFGIDE